MVQFKGQEVQFQGSFPVKGDNLPDFTLTDTALAVHSGKDFSGKALILNIFPSVDTGVCAASVRRFNEKAASLGDKVAVLCISKDLPFAHGRFCGAEGIDRVVSLSTFRDGNFGVRFGLEMSNTPLAGLLGRAVIVADSKGRVVYSQLVPDIGTEPDYEAAVQAVESLG